MAASLAQHGQRSPVLVAAGADGFPVLIDGYLRVEALLELGRDLVEALFLDVSESEALILAHRLEAKRRRSALEEGWLIQELMERHGMGQREVAMRLSRSVSWVSRRLSLVRVLPASVQEAVRVSRVPAQAAMRYLVPLARAKRGECESLVSGLGNTVVSVREVERLYRGLRRGSQDTRERILTAPILYLKAEEATEAERLPEGDPAAPLVKDLDSVAGICRRARRRVDEGVVAELGARGSKAVKGAGAGARLAFDALMEELEEKRCWTETPV